MQGLGVVDKGGNGWFLDRANVFTDIPTPMFPSGAVNPQFANLVGAAHILYKVAAHTRDAMGPLIDLLEDHGLDAAVPSIMAHQAALDYAMRCAVEGLEKMSSAKK